MVARGNTACHIIAHPNDQQKRTNCMPFYNQMICNLIPLELLRRSSFLIQWLSGFDTTGLYRKKIAYEYQRQGRRYSIRGDCYGCFAKNFFALTRNAGVARSWFSSINNFISGIISGYQADNFSRTVRENAFTAIASDGDAI